ncbi:MAG TPA: site-2 protease family protein [Candidatus Acidoferrales bacterium]|nr:site-2 protease family protein [Candidatus Acidoferrales bacterium]
MRWSFPAGRLFNIPIRVHYTFLLLLAFIWYVESTMRGPEAGFYSVVFCALIFVCVLFHELAHSLVARSYGLTIASIILSPIGGISQITEIPRDPAKEVGITIAGPVSNFVIAGVLLLFGKSVDSSIQFSEITLQSGNMVVDLFWANVMLGLFNIIPAYPMDGGRILRGIIAMKKGYLEATRLAADVGKLFAIGFIIVGFFYNWWLILVGIFVFSGASSEAEAAVLSSKLEKITVGELMIKDFKTISPYEPLTAVVEKSLHTFQNDFPVVSDGKFVGVLTRSAVIESLHHHQHEIKVGEIARRSFPIIDVNGTAASALTALRAAHLTVAPVEDNGTLKGIITVEKLLEASDVFNGKD